MLYNPYYNINPFDGYPVSVYAPYIGTYGPYGYAPYIGTYDPYGYAPYPYVSTSPYSAYLIAATASALYR